MGFLARTHTEQEESRDDSSNRSWLAECQLKGEVDHMDRLSSSQCSQEDIFEKGWEMDSSPCTSHVIHRLRISRIQWRKARENTLFPFDFSESYTSSQEREKKRHHFSSPCSVRYNSPRYPRLLAFTSLATVSARTCQHTAYQQPPTRFFIYLTKHQKAAVLDKNAFERRLKVSFEYSHPSTMGWLRLHWGWNWSKSCRV